MIHTFAAGLNWSIRGAARSSLQLHLLRKRRNKLTLKTKKRFRKEWSTYNELLDGTLGCTLDYRHRLSVYKSLQNLCGSALNQSKILWFHTWVLEKKKKWQINVQSFRRAVHRWEQNLLGLPLLWPLHNSLWIPGIKYILKISAWSKQRRWYLNEA